MTLERHCDPDAFLAAAAPVLARNAAVCALVQSWTDGWRAGRMVPSYAATHRAAGAAGFALQREGPLLIENSDPAAAVAFATDLAANGVVVPSVIGETAACDAFAAQWRVVTGQRHGTGMRMRHHVLTTQRPVATPDGTMRPAQIGETPWLVRHALAFAAEVRLPDKPEHLCASVARRVAGGDLRVWESEGIAAFASSVAVGTQSARVGLVYTLPDRRGRGFATALVAAIVRERLDAGVRRVFLVTDRDNPTSNALYARIGFEPLSDTVRYDFFVARP